MANNQELKVKIDEWFSKNEDGMLSDLGKLIEINSVAGEKKEGAPFGTASREALSAAESMLRDKGFDVNVFEDMVITSTFGPNPPELGILAHLDVVAAGEGWETDPFKLTEKDGILYGRGVVDNKGPVVAAIYAVCCVRDICPELTHGVQLIFGSGEEIGWDDIKQYLKKNTTPPNVFTPDAEFPIVNIEKGRFMPVFGAKWEKDTTLPRVVSVTGGTTPNIVPNKAMATIEGLSLEDTQRFCAEFSEKTGATLTACVGDDECCTDDGFVHITAEGTAAHASLPHLGNNAQTALIEMLAAMPFAKSDGFEYLCKLNSLFPHGDNVGKAIGIYFKDDKTGEITVNFGVLRFSEYEFSGNFDSRTPSAADDADLFELTKAALDKEGIAISMHQINRCHHTPEETPFVQKLLSIYEDYTGEERKCLAIGGQTYVHEIDGGVAFGMVMPDTPDHNNIHNAGEYIRKDRLLMNAKMFAKAIVDVCG
jgi:succinyl-diaminopimelate desuccinylase